MRRVRKRRTPCVLLERLSLADLLPVLFVLWGGGGGGEGERDKGVNRPLKGTGARVVEVRTHPLELLLTLLLACGRDDLSDPTTGAGEKRRMPHDGHQPG